MFLPGSSLSEMVRVRTMLMLPCYRRVTSWSQSSPRTPPRRPAGLPRGGIAGQKGLGWVRRADLQSLSLASVQVACTLLSSASLSVKWTDVAAFSLVFML